MKIRKYIIIIFLLVSGCAPTYMSGKVKITIEEIDFINNETKEVIPNALILPRYDEGKLISTLGGHGPGTSSKSQIYYSYPFILNSGYPLNIKQPKSAGIMFGPGWAYLGNTVILDGATVFAPGYDPKWINSFWTDKKIKISLSPIPKEKSLLQFNMIKKWLLGEFLNQEEKQIFPEHEFYPYTIKFDLSIRDELLRYVDDCINKLS